MKALFQSTAVALVLGLTWAPPLVPAAVAQDAEACSDFGMLDASDDDIVELAEYEAWGDGVFGDWDADSDGAISEVEFDQCFEAGGWYESELDDDWEEDADDLYGAWDDDGDGALTEIEFADDEEFAEWDGDDDDDLEDQEFLIDDFLL